MYRKRFWISRQKAGYSNTQYDIKWHPLYYLVLSTLEDERFQLVHFALWASKSGSDYMLYIPHHVSLRQLHTVDQKKAQHVMQ